MCLSRPVIIDVGSKVGKFEVVLCFSFLIEKVESAERGPFEQWWLRDAERERHELEAMETEVGSPGKGFVEENELLMEGVRYRCKRVPGDRKRRRQKRTVEEERYVTSQLQRISTRTRFVMMSGQLNLHRQNTAGGVSQRTNDTI